MRLCAKIADKDTHYLIRKRIFPYYFSFFMKLRCVFVLFLDGHALSKGSFLSLCDDFLAGLRFKFHADIV